MNSPAINNEPENTSGDPENEYGAEGSQIRSCLDDPRYLMLRQWITENEPDLFAALRPLGGALADIRGHCARDTTSDLLVEVTRIALDQAYPRYNLSYPSPRLWLLKIAYLVGRRWREQAAIATRRQATHTQDEDEMDVLINALPSPRSDDPARIVIGSLWLRQRLTSLSPLDRIIVESHVVDDLSFAETAVRVSMTEGAARLRFHRAVRRLRQQERDESEMPSQHDSNMAGSGRRRGGTND